MVSERMFQDEIGTKSEGFPHFRGIPVVMTSRSRKYIIISPKKVRKRDVREISSNYLCKKEQPSWKSEKLAHFKYLKLKYFINEWTPCLDILTGS